MAYTLQLKRHVNYANKEAALNGLKAYLATAAVGEPAIATYGGSEQTYDSEKVLFGIKGAHGYTIFDYEAMPADVQAALNAIKGEGYDKDGTYATLKAIADALTIINGADTVEGSIAKAKKDAKDYAGRQIDAAVKALDVTDAAVAGQFVDSVSETDGVVSVTRKPITSNDKSVVLNTANGVDLSVNIDGTTILRNGKTGKLSVASAALVQYVGADAIKVSEVQDGNKTISLKLNTDDKVLTQTTNGLLANINLTWNNTEGLKLIGKGGAEIATVPAADFIKDGMLENVTLEKNPKGQTAGTYLHFVFNTDAKETDKKTDIYVNVTELIDIYTGSDGVQVSGKNISAVKDSSSESFLSIGPSGIKVSGVQDAINAAVKAEETKRTDADKVLQSAIDKVESSVGLATDGSHVKTNGTYTKNATTVVGEIAALDTQVKKNADAIAAETTRATAKENEIINDVFGEVKLPEGQSVVGIFGQFAETVEGKVDTLNTQVTKNTDAIKANSGAIKQFGEALSSVAAEETRIAKTVIGEDKLKKGKSVMDVILENEETAQQAIEKLTKAAGVLSGEQIKYTAPTVSGVFSSTTSIMDMLNTIDEKWNTIDCGTYE